MSLYEGIKDVITVAQKADNVDLVLKLLGIGKQALDMQAETENLRTENSELKTPRYCYEISSNEVDFYCTFLTSQKTHITSQAATKR